MMQNEITIVGNLAKPIDTLINKIADATGILYEPVRIRKKAKAEVEASLIKLENELQQRALQRLVIEEIKKQENIESITEKSFENLNENAEPEKIDNDWLGNFFDKCKNISNEEMQKHWAKMLSSEANNAQSISKKTIEIFYMMEKKDVELYMKLLSYIWIIDSTIHIIIKDTENDIFKKRGIYFSSLIHLEDIGLIKFDNLAGFGITKVHKQLVLDYFGKIITIEFDKEENNEFPLGRILFTQAGRELLKIIDFKDKNNYLNSDDEYFEYMKKEFSKNYKVL